MMKKKIMLMFIVLVMAISMLGCGSVSNDSVTNTKTQNSAFTENVHDYRDEETGVHYLIYSKTSPAYTYSGMCPRYNADGTLYVD